MRTLAAGLAMAAAMVGPAWALQVPSPGKEDPRMCTVIYRPGDVVDVHAAAGISVALEFGQTERIAHVTVSDSAHLKYALVGEGGNRVFFKATDAMPPEALSIRTLRDDGKTRDYEVQWAATRDPQPHQDGAKVAATDERTVASVTPLPVNPTPCWVVSYQYPADEAEAKAAKWRAAQAQKASRAIEAALHQPTPCTNWRYTGMGDPSLVPVSVCDDGQITELHFQGVVPAIFGVLADGTDTLLAGVTTEDNGVVKLHGVPPQAAPGLPTIRLRQGDLIFCIFNRGIAAPVQSTTGTVSPSVVRTVGTGK